MLDKTMDEDDRCFGVWDRVDASIELGVAVGYPLFSVHCHVGVRSKGSTQPQPSNHEHEHAACDLLSKIRIYRDCSIPIIALNK